MQLKFYLNKFLKADGIEYYTLDTLLKLKDAYGDFIEDSDGGDPDFPLVSFNTKGKKIKGKNIHQVLGDDDGTSDVMVDRFGQSIDSSKQAKEDREYLEKVKREVS
jgi:hypothetical protein